MDDYVAEILEDYRNNMNGEAKITAADHLFVVNANILLISKSYIQYFNTMTYTLLFISNRVCPELQEAVSFLKSRVKAP